MAYCRWSSDNFLSDVYVYLSDDGITIHIANCHPSTPSPDSVVYELIINKVPKDKLKDVKKRIEDWRENTTWNPIDHPLAGKSITGLTASEAAVILNKLRSEDIHVPERVEEAILEDFKEED